MKFNLLCFQILTNRHRVAISSVLIAIFFFTTSSGLAEVFEFGIASDMGNKNANQQLVLRSLLQNKVNKLIMAGDNIYRASSTYEETWSDFTKNNFIFEVTALGNHHNGYSAEIRFFKMPAEFYVKNYGTKIQFIVLNSDNIENVSQQFVFLEDALKKTKKNMITFLVYHHPTYTISDFHEWTEKKEFQLKMRKIFSSYADKITAVIVGHDHITAIGHFGEIPYIVAGATQDIRKDKPTDNVQDGVKVSTSWFFKGNPTWVKMSIDDKKSKIKFNVFDSKENQELCSFELARNKKYKLEENCDK